MQKLYDFEFKLTNLSNDTSSAHPSPKDSARVETSLFDKVTPASSNSIDEATLPFITNVIIKHSSAFNSECATGMNKLQQLQFVDMLKKMIIGKWK
jgi:hypothetical protein